MAGYCTVGDVIDIVASTMGEGAGRGSNLRLGVSDVLELLPKEEQREVGGRKASAESRVPYAVVAANIGLDDY